MDFHNSNIDEGGSPIVGLYDYIGKPLVHFQAWPLFWHYATYDQQFFSQREWVSHFFFGWGRMILESRLLHLYGPQYIGDEWCTNPLLQNKWLN